MGNNFQKYETKPTQISLKNFKINRIIGLGGCGKVWEVQHTASKKLYAMKQMNKIKVITRRCINSVLTEKKFLSILKHPFIVNMQYAFQDRDNLYLLMDLMTGGDLRYWIHRKKSFSETQARFFAACIVTGLEYLHINHIIHRDIKPENLVFDSKGYLRITDLGIASKHKPEDEKENSGTPGYMAPEVMESKPYGPESDYFALGVILFECMMGYRPFTGRNRREIREKIFSKQVELTRKSIPKGWSMESADFVNKCIERNPSNRLGVHGIYELKNHAWLRDFNWKSLFAKKIKAPLIPDQGDNFEESWLIKRENEDKEILTDESVQAVFAGYFYDKNLEGKQNEESTK